MILVNMAVIIGADTLTIFDQTSCYCSGTDDEAPLLLQVIVEQMWMDSVGF